MSNLEKLAEQISNSMPEKEDGTFYMFNRHELEAFAKAYAQQSSEPVAVQTKQIYEVAINGSWMESNLADYVKHRGIKRTLFTHPPASVSLEKYNKLLEVLEEVDRKAQAGLCYFDLNTVREFHKDIRRAYAQAIAKHKGQS